MQYAGDKSDNCAQISLTSDPVLKDAAVRVKTWATCHFFETNSDFKTFSARTFHVASRPTAEVDPPSTAEVKERHCCQLSQGTASAVSPTMNEWSPTYIFPQMNRLRKRILLNSSSISPSNDSRPNFGHRDVTAALEYIDTGHSDMLTKTPL